MSRLLLVALLGCTPPDADSSRVAEPLDSAIDSASGDSGPTTDTESTGRETLPIPAGPWEAVAVGAVHACLLREGRVSCFGDELGGARSPPDFDDVLTMSAGVAHSCVLRVGGVVSCWGDDSLGQATVPDERFIQVDAGHDFTCAITTGGELRCWGNNFVGQATPAPGSSWASVSAGGYHAAALDAEGSLDCWGSAPLCFSNGGARGVAVAAGFEHVVALQADGTSVCSGSMGEGRCPTDAVLNEITAGGYHTCGLPAERGPDGDGALRCWPGGLPEAPYYDGSKHYKTVSAGLNSTCGITAAGEVDCWTWTGGSWP